MAEPEGLMSESRAACPSCGKPLVDGAVFCSFCGSRLPASVDEQTTWDDSGDLRRPVDARPSEIEPPLVPKRYETGRLLGRGGMGEVWTAYDRLFRRVVALKLLQPHAGTDDHQRFLEEAKIAAQLEHPGIVPVYDMGRLEDGRIFLTMRRLDRRTLSDVLRDIDAGRTEVSRTRLLQMFVQVCLAVSYANEKSVVHRDLKPGNIMVGSMGEVTVVDWGLAKVLGSGPKLRNPERDLTKRGDIRGTFAYMSPEQVTGNPDLIDRRTDVYALGIVLFQLLTGGLPFEGDDLAQFTARLSKDPPHPAEVAADARIPADLDRACVKALASVADERYQIVKELATVVQDHLDGILEAERRRAEATARLIEARHALDLYNRLRSQYETGEEALRQLSWRTARGGPLEQRRPLFAATEALATLKRQREEAFHLTAATLTAALSHDPGYSEARDTFADLYMQRLLDSETAGRVDEASFFRAQVEIYDDGSRAAILKGYGNVAISTEPPGGYT